MNSGFGGSRKALEAALLDYHRAPGKHLVLLRRPEILFSLIKEVLQLASGRLPEGDAAPGLAVQRAAGFFVRTALLHPAADHYALLGLERSADAAAIKDRYRQMMRLMHPDFAMSAAAGGNWPTDAASRINQAYETLCCESKRRAYDEKLANGGAAPRRGSAPASIRQLKTAAAGAPAPDPRRLLRRMAIGFGMVAVLALTAGLLVLGPDRESLVQRERRPAAPIVLLAESAAPPSQPAVLILPPAGAQSALLQRPASMPAAPAPSGVLAPPPGMEPAPAAAALAPLPALPPLSAAAMSVRIIAVSQDSPAAPAIQSAASPNTVVAQAPPPAPPAPLPAPAVTLAEAHTLLSALLQQMESGSGDRLLAALDRDARNTSGAQALVRQYNKLVEGARAVRVSNLHLIGNPREDRLLVKGQVLLEISDDVAVRAKELSLEAEFAKRNGAVVMTRLAPAHVTAQQLAQ
jgi:hypothetical protein